MLNPIVPPIASAALAVLAVAAADPVLGELQGWLPVVSGVGNVGGLGALAFLFARDLILTRGQHDRRMADAQRAHEAEVANLKAYHEAIRAADAARYDDMKTSRDYHAAAHDVDRARADGLSRELSALALESAAFAGTVTAAAEQAAREVAHDGG